MTVTLELPERPDDSLLYQRYYVAGLEAHAQVRIGPPLRPSSLLARRASRQIEWDVHLQRLHPRLARGRVAAAGFVGEYVVDGARFAIDARDSHPIHDPEKLERSDLYFKANAWPDREYDARVRPIVNGNGLLTPKRIAFLRALRDTPKDVDVAFLSNVWGAQAHNVRLFEQLARRSDTHDLLAIFPRGTDDPSLRRRLVGAGVPVADGWPKPALSPEELWRRLARARVVVLRPGMHGCVSWRTLDLLCMGACIVWDAAPTPRWPEPLLDGVHYVDAGIARAPHAAEAADDEYAQLDAAIDGLLAAPGTAESMRRAAAAYFDDHAAPERVAAYVLATVGARA